MVIIDEPIMFAKTKQRDTKIPEAEQTRIQMKVFEICKNTNTFVLALQTRQKVDPYMKMKDTFSLNSGDDWVDYIFVAEQWDPQPDTPDEKTGRILVKLAKNRYGPTVEFSFYYDRVTGSETKTICLDKF